MLRPSVRARGTEELQALGAAVAAVVLAGSAQTEAWGGLALAEIQRQGAAIL